jgi:hypothetical protein
MTQINTKRKRQQAESVKKNHTERGRKNRSVKISL